MSNVISEAKSSLLSILETIHVAMQYGEEIDQGLLESEIERIYKLLDGDQP